MLSKQKPSVGVLWWEKCLLGMDFQGKKAPSQPCLQLGDIWCVQGLVSSHEPDLGQETVFSHLAKVLNKSTGRALAVSASSLQTCLLTYSFV